MKVMRKKTINNGRRSMTRAHRTSDILKQISEFWGPVLSDAAEETARQKACIVTFGTLGAAKLLFRMADSGRLGIEVDSAVWPVMDEAADEVVEDCGASLADPLTALLSLPRIPWQGAPETHRDPSTMRRHHWCPFDSDEDHLDLAAEYLTEIFGQADAFWRELTDWCLQSLKRLDGVRGQVSNEFMAQTLGLTAACKVLIAIWVQVDEKFAAALEFLVEFAVDKACEQAGIPM